MAPVGPLAPAANEFVLLAGFHLPLALLDQCRSETCPQRSAANGAASPRGSGLNSSRERACNHRLWCAGRPERRTLRVAADHPVLAGMDDLASERANPLEIAVGPERPGDHSDPDDELWREHDDRLS